MAVMGEIEWGLGLGIKNLKEQHTPYYSHQIFRLHLVFYLCEHSYLKMVSTW
jgi:hypothetical protein